MRAFRTEAPVAFFAGVARTALGKTTQAALVSDRLSAIVIGVAPKRLVIASPSMGTGTGAVQMH